MGVDVYTMAKPRQRQVAMMSTGGIPRKKNHPKPKRRVRKVRQVAMMRTTQTAKKKRKRRPVQNKACQRVFHAYSKLVQRQRKKQAPTAHEEAADFFDRLLGYNTNR